MTDQYIFIVHKKGQATFVDVMLLGLFIAVLMALSYTLGNQPLTTQVSHEEAFYANSMMLSAMQWHNSTYGSFVNPNLSLAEALDLYFCSDNLSRSDIEAAFGYILNATSKPGTAYIFYADGEVDGQFKTVWAWNKQADVCTKSITVVTFDLQLSCNAAGPITPMLGIWPDWKKLPPKSACL